MSHIRHISPAVFIDDRLAECSPLARILYMGLPCLADCKGRLEDRPRRIKAQLLPYDEVDIEALLSELASKGLITRYEANGVHCIFLPDFAETQRPRASEKKKGSTLPPSPTEPSKETLSPPSPTTSHPTDQSDPTDPSHANQQSAVRNPQSTIPNPQSPPANPQSAVRNPQSTIPTPQSPPAKPQSAVRNPQSTIPTPPSRPIGSLSAAEIAELTLQQIDAQIAKSRQLNRLAQRPSR